MVKLIQIVGNKKFSMNFFLKIEKKIAAPKNRYLKLTKCVIKNGS